MTHHWTLAEVEEEMIQQHKDWGEQNHEPLKWLAILMEEVGEASREVLDCHEGWETRYRIELIQVAAVAASAIESFDRGKWKHEE